VSHEIRPLRNVAGSVDVREVRLHAVVDDDRLIDLDAAAAEPVEVWLDTGRQDDEVGVDRFAGGERDALAATVRDALHGGAEVQRYRFLLQPLLHDDGTLSVEHS